MKLTSKHTIFACFIGYFTQTLVINFPPLLYITFEQDMGISLGQISVLITICFVTQLMGDILAVKFPRIFNSRRMLVAAHVLATAGLLSLALLPSIMDPFTAICISTVLGAVGGGIVEVMVSPTVEACPTKNKSGMMSILHSVYCIGLATVVLLSTLFFACFDIKNWQILALLWAIVPLFGAIMFAIVPLYKLPDEPQKQTNQKSIFSTSVFWAFFVIMLCAGAAELTMSQWVSSFAEAGLNVEKSFGDLLGPFAFAILMASSRIIYGKFSDKIDLSKFIIFSAALCAVTYIGAALSPSPIFSLICCAVCGFSVGIMWPGTLSLAVATIKRSGVKMFALLALGGDIGCTLGPSVAGVIADTFDNNFKVSFLFSTLFPLTIIIFVILINAKMRKTDTDLPKGN